MTLAEYNRAVELRAAEQMQQQKRTSPYQPLAPTYTPPSYAPPSTAPSYTYTPPSYTPPPVYRPRSGSTFDATSANSYSWQKNRDGGTDVNGMNLNTGSMWRTTIKPDGSMRSTDSKFNPWSYDAGSCLYMNYGTGRICTGTGYARVCIGGK